MRISKMLGATMIAGAPVGAGETAVPATAPADAASRTPPPPGGRPCEPACAAQRLRETTPRPLRARSALSLGGATMAAQRSHDGQRA